MSAPKFNRTTERFYVRGIDLNNPQDSVRQGFVPIIENVRSFTEGVIQPRQGLGGGPAALAGTVLAGKSPVHSIRRLNDPASNTFARIVGVGDSLAFGTTVFPYTRAQYNGSNVVFSGNPLALIPYRPDQSPQSWMYVGDSPGANNFMYKIAINGTVHQMGLQPPTVPPTITNGAQVFGTQLYTNFQNAAGWTNDGTVITTGIASQTRVNVGVINTTVVVYDDGRAIPNGSPGWCNIVLPAAAISVLGRGAILEVVTGGPTLTQLLVHDVFPTNSVALLSIANIIYDSGVNGTCTIQASTAVDELVQDTIIFIGGLFYARVTSIAKGPDGSLSFRCSTGINTVGAGQTLAVIPSARVYDTGAGMTPAGGDPIGQRDITTGTPTPPVPGIGWLNINTAVDLTEFHTISANGLGVTDDDYVHLSFQTTDLSAITQGRILFNNDAEVTPTYTRNFYYRAFTPNDLVSATTAKDTSINNRNTIIINRQLDNGGRPVYSGSGLESGNDDPWAARRDAREARGSRIDNPPKLVAPGTDPNAPTTDDPARSQTGTGASQWHELIFRRGELVRVGNDESRGYNNINGFRLELTINSNTGPTVGIAINSLSLYGSGALDVGDRGDVYLYRYRYRCSTTGVRSNYSPVGRAYAKPYRETVSVVCTSSTAPEVDKIDIERWGGSLTNWIYVGTCSNSTRTFTDTIADDALVANVAFSEGDSNFQPFPCLLPPKTGTTAVAGVCGIMVRDVGANFDPRWVKDTPLKIDGVQTAITRVLSSSLMEIRDSLGTRSSVAWEIPQPEIIQPVRSLWGPYNGRFFGCGDSNNPGTVYWTTGNNPDSTQESFYLEVTATSEPLQGGGIFNGRCYVFSSERLFLLEEIGPDSFIAIEVPGRNGLFSPWALCVGERMWYLDKDGIYQTAGGDPINITDRTMRPLFVREGTGGQAVNGFNPPKIVAGEEANLRLAYYDSRLYFTYRDSANTYRVLSYTVFAGPEGGSEAGWWPDVYTPGLSCLYGEEGTAVHSLLAGGTNGNLYSIGGPSDNGSAIAWHLRSGAYDAGDRRALKLWGDSIVEADPNNATINVAIGYNNYSNTLALTPTSFTGATRVQQILDISSGSEFEARNIQLDLTGSSTTATPLLYFWEPSFALRPEASVLRASQWEDAGQFGDKFFQGIKIRANTGGITRTVQVQYDIAGVGDTLLINHNGDLQKDYSFAGAFTANQVRLIPTDGAPDAWQLYDWQWVFQPEPPIGYRWESQQTSHGYRDFFSLKELYVTLKSTSAVILTITRTDDGQTFSYTIDPSGTGIGTNGQKQRIRVKTAPIKGKALIYTFAGIGNTVFRLYKDDTVALIKPWSSEDQFVPHWVFGAPHGDGRVEI